MTFDNKVIQYRVMLDEKTQLFIVVDARDEKKVAYGITIEQAVKELKKAV